MSSPRKCKFVDKRDMPGTEYWGTSLFQGKDEEEKPAKEALKKYHRSTKTTINTV